MADLQIVAWQWRKRQTWFAGQSDEHSFWSEWGALQPPYMDARELAKTDPENYELRAMAEHAPAQSALDELRREVEALRADRDRLLGESKVPAWELRLQGAEAFAEVYGVQDDWRSQAAAWLRRKADEQERMNRDFPKHVEAYPSWTDRPRQFRWLADDLDAERAAIDTIRASTDERVGKVDDDEPGQLP